MARCRRFGPCDPGLMLRRQRTSRSPTVGPNLMLGLGRDANAEPYVVGTLRRPQRKRRHHLEISAAAARASAAARATAEHEDATSPPGCRRSRAVVRATPATTPGRARGRRVGVVDECAVHDEAGGRPRDLKPALARCTDAQLECEAITIDDDDPRPRRDDRRRVRRRGQLLPRAGDPGRWLGEAAVGTHPNEGLGREGQEPIAQRARHVFGGRAVDVRCCRSAGASKLAPTSSEWASGPSVALLLRAETFLDQLELLLGSGHESVAGVARSPATSIATGAGRAVVPAFGSRWRADCVVPSVRLARAQLSHARRFAAAARPRVAVAWPIGSAGRPLHVRGCSATGGE